MFHCIYLFSTVISYTPLNLVTIDLVTDGINGMMVLSNNIQLVILDSGRRDCYLLL